MLNSLFYAVTSSFPIYFMLFAQTETLNTGHVNWNQLGVAGIVASALSGVIFFLAKKYDSARDERVIELKEQNKEMNRNYDALVRKYEELLIKQTRINND